MSNPNRLALATLALWLGAICAAAPASAAVRKVEAASVATPTSAATQVARWVIASDDNHGLPFAVVDKAAAKVFVYGASGQLRGMAPALLGLARGDGSAPGIGDRRMAAIRPDERTTPAGRFLAAYGPASGHRKVLWVDYATAISLHPVVTSNPKEQRLKRLQSPTPKDNRITYGCINVSAAFYEKVVRRTFTGTKGVVYVLPETQPLDAVFPALRLQAADAQENPVPERSQAVRLAGAASAPGVATR